MTFEEEYKNLRHKHLIELKALMIKHSQIRDSARIQHKINMSNCAGEVQKSLTTRMYISEMSELLVIENDERWRLSHIHKEEIAELRKSNKLTI